MTRPPEITATSRATRADSTFKALCPTRIVRTLCLACASRPLRIASALVAALLLAAAVSCGHATVLGYDDTPHRTPSDTTSDNGQSGINHPSEVSIAYLRSLAAGLSTTIDLPFSVCGRVTANDAYGEYYQTICVEDSTGGIEVAVEGYTLYRLFALYDYVRVECHGLSLGRYGSRIRLGGPPSGEYSVSPIPQRDIGRYMSKYSAGEHTEEAFEPVVTTIGALVPSYVGRTVRIDGLYSSEAGSGWCDYDVVTGTYVDTERMVYDDKGDMLRVSMRGECRYVSEPIPWGSFSLIGIVEYRDASYHLRPTNHGIIF